QRCARMAGRAVAMAERRRHALEAEPGGDDGVLNHVFGVVPVDEVVVDDLRVHRDGRSGQNRPEPARSAHVVHRRMTPATPTSVMSSAGGPYRASRPPWSLPGQV